MKRTGTYVALAAVCLLFFASCKKVEQPSDIPYIEFKSFNVFDTIDILGNVSKGGRLDIYFEDGDGNVGLDTPYPGDLDTTNMFITLYRKNGDDFLKVTDKTDPLMPSDYRIPYMERDGQYKIMKGTISLRFIYPINSNDIIKYEIMIKDRRNNYSNIVSTCEIPLHINGEYSL